MQFPQLTLKIKDEDGRKPEFTETVIVSLKNFLNSSKLIIY